MTRIEPAQSSFQQNKPAEKGVSIAVGAPAEPEEEDVKPASGYGAFDEERYNEYMLSTAGPRKQRVFGAVEEFEDEDLAAFDADAGATQQAVDGAYSMKHQGEKFALGGVRGATSASRPGKEKTPEEIEAEEMAAALEQIRQMEEQALVRKNSSVEAEKVQELLKEGEAVYQLYSIMIHSGGAFGGHYYAYIKSFEDGKWHDFNDTTVAPLKDEEEIFNTFGGPGGRPGTAYLLMYRRVRGDEAPYRFSDDLVPDYLKAEIAADTEKAIKEQQALEEKLLALRLKVYHEGRPLDISVKKD